MPPTLPTSSVARRASRRPSALFGLAAAGCVVALLLSQAIVPGWPSAVIVAFGAVGIAIASAACIDRARTERSHRVIAYIAQGTRLATPLPEFCRAAALGETWRTRRALERVADLIASSAPLGDALAAAVPEMSPRDVGLARAGEANGALPSTLARLAAVRGPARNDDGHALPSPFAGDASRRQFPLTYLAMFLFLIPVICTLLLVFVAPKFAQIMRDFGAPTPTWMRVIAAMERAGIQLDVTLPLFTLAAGLLLVVMIVRPLRAARRRSARRWRPTLARFQHDRDLADVCQTLADAFAARRPADAAIAEASRLDVSATLSRRLTTWHDHVAAGRPLAASARAAGLPPLVADLVVDGSPDATDAFLFLARHYRSRSDRAHDWLVAMASPAVTILAAVPVALIAYALFDSMRALTDASMPTHLGM